MASPVKQWKWFDPIASKSNQSIQNIPSHVFPGPNFPISTLLRFPHHIYNVHSDGPNCPRYTSQPPTSLKTWPVTWMEHPFGSLFDLLKAQSTMTDVSSPHKRQARWKMCSEFLTSCTNNPCSFASTGFNFNIKMHTSRLSTLVFRGLKQHEALAIPARCARCSVSSLWPK